MSRIRNNSISRIFSLTVLGAALAFAPAQSFAKGSGSHGGGNHGGGYKASGSARSFSVPKSVMGAQMHVNKAPMARTLQMQHNGNAGKLYVNKVYKTPTNTLKSNHGPYVNKVFPKSNTGTYVNKVFPKSNTGTYVNKVFPKSNTGIYVNKAYPKLAGGTYVNKVFPKGPYVNKLYPKGQYVNKFYPKGQYVNKFKKPVGQIWSQSNYNGFMWPQYSGFGCGSYCATGWCWPYPGCNGGGCGTSCQSGGTLIADSGIATSDGSDTLLADASADAAGQVVDAAPAISGVDLELADLELVDAGNAETKQGPAYRITIHNNGDAPSTAFDVALVATQGEDPSAKAPAGVQRLSKLDAGETVQVDVRLPATASQSTTLFVGVDPRGEVQETTKENNVARVARGDIAMLAQQSVSR